MGKHRTEIKNSDGAFIMEDMHERALFDACGHEICSCNKLEETLNECRNYFSRVKLHVFDQVGKLKKECSKT